MKFEYTFTDSPVLAEQADELFRSAQADLARRADRIMMFLLAAEWPALVITAMALAPFTWDGVNGRINPHFLAALLAGPMFIGPAIFLAWRYPGGACRHALAAAQILVSVVLIDVTNGRIESHFHVFGSLAILAFYRDWKVLVTASAITAVDHLVRGYWFPQSVYGVFTINPWRWAEHAFWVVFENSFLIINSATSMREMRMVAIREAQLSWGAYYDVLTGLPNRRALEARFTTAVETSAIAARAILFIDLDRFKHANDTLGHAIGDILLKQVAARLSSALDPGATLARIGGDEFVVFLDCYETGDAPENQASKLLASLTRQFDVQGHQLLLSASVGISLYPDHGTDLRELQERADRAMYVAKAHGRNQAFVFSTEVARRELILQDIARDLSHSLSRGEITLCFQPLMHRSGKLSGFEALVRWTHPVHGAVSPADFIPMAERSGYINSLGDWVLQEACRQCIHWNEQGDDLGVAVNVSSVQLEQPHFASRVLQIIGDSGLDPSRLTLELTESVLIGDVSKAISQLADLRQRGVRVALDDFGTGYSSLSYLSALPADTIKLDRSFLMRETEGTAFLIQSIIEMAHGIGLKIIAEGVETRDQRNRLQDLACDGMQGFYFSPPIPAAKVDGYLNDYWSDRSGPERPSNVPLLTEV